MNFNSSRQTGLGLLQQQMLFIQVVFRIEDHTCWFAIVHQVGMQICPRITSLHITAQNKLVPGQACNEVKAHAEGHHTTARALSLAEPLARPGGHQLGRETHHRTERLYPVDIRVLPGF